VLQTENPKEKIESREKKRAEKGREQRKERARRERKIFGRNERRERNFGTNTVGTGGVFG
jgi:hypothetical protein